MFNTHKSDLRVKEVPPDHIISSSTKIYQNIHQQQLEKSIDRNEKEENFDVINIDPLSYSKHLNEHKHKQNKNKTSSSAVNDSTAIPQLHQGTLNITAPAMILSQVKSSSAATQTLNKKVIVIAVIVEPTKI